MNNLVVTKTNASHKTRKIYEIQEKNIELYMTKHGHYRILEDRNISFNHFGRIISSIGLTELDKHFKQAAKLFPLDQRKEVDWKIQVDYVISVYDVIHGLVIMLGLHPHLNRMTIVTIIPRIDHVASNNVFGCYRVDNRQTKSRYIDYIIPRTINIKNVLVN